MSRSPIIDLTRFKISSIHCNLVEERGVKVMRVTFFVPAVNTGAPSTVSIEKEWPSGIFNVDVTNQMIREAIHEAVLHEVDECLMIDGKRLFDPHKKTVKVDGQTEGRAKVIKSL